MKELTNWTEVIFESLRGMIAKVGDILPSILGAFIIFLLGWLIAKLISGIIRRLLTSFKFDDLANKLHADDLLEKAKIKITATSLVSKFVYWMLMLFVIITVSDTLGWETVSNEISKLLGLLPKILVAVAFFIIGMFIARVVRDFINGATASLGISSGRIIGNIVFYFLLVIVTITALDQAGLDTSIITSNVLLIFGAVMLSAAISYGFASRQLLSNILASFFSRHTFKPGQVIELEGLRGEIVEMSSISVIIRTSAQEKVVIPTQELINNKVKIIG